MIIITTPAKRLEENKQYPNVETTKPRFLSKTEKLAKLLKSKSKGQLKKLFSVSENLAELNYDRFQIWEKTHTTKNSRPSVFTFNGDVHREIHAEGYRSNELEFLNDHIRFLSGFYGILRPFDLMQPYRLMMGTKLDINSDKSLYKFWTKDITKALNDDIETTDSKYLIDLASNEYSDAVNYKDIKAKTIHIEFRQERDGKLKNIGILNKKSRGMLIEFIVKNKVKSLKQLKKFNNAGYNLHDEDESTITFKTKKL